MSSSRMCVVYFFGKERESEIFWDDVCTEKYREIVIDIFWRWDETPSMGAGRHASALPYPRHFFLSFSYICFSPLQRTTTILHINYISFYSCMHRTRKTGGS